MACPSGPSTAASEPSTTPPPLQGRKIAVALTGGIACYKTAALVSKLVQAGAAVRVLMTDAATHFITPLTLRSLSNHDVFTSIWQSSEEPSSPHVAVARWCDSLVIAPATADVIGRLAHGLADDVVTLVACALPRQIPVLIAPAMNADMWANPMVQKNLATLKDVLKYQVVGPQEGWQACRTLGPGRMSEPEEIFEAVKSLAVHRA
jgi:phosphopantothenoylcysteine decarboxylase/phosphopantothenate--cysteine ligase